MPKVSRFIDLKDAIKNARQELMMAEKDWYAYRKKAHEQFGFFAQTILQDLQKNLFPACKYQVVTLPAEDDAAYGEQLEYRLIDSEKSREMVTMAGTILESINISLYFNKNKLLRGYLCYAMTDKGEVSEVTMCNLSEEYLCQAVEGLFEEDFDEEDEDDFEEDSFEEDDFFEEPTFEETDKKIKNKVKSTSKNKKTPSN